MDPSNEKSRSNSGFCLLAETESRLWSGEPSIPFRGIHTFSRQGRPDFIGIQPLGQVSKDNNYNMTDFQPSINCR
jgi:hypothetical protein